MRVAGTVLRSVGGYCDPAPTPAMTHPRCRKRYFFELSAGMLMVLSAGIFMVVVSAGAIFVVSVIIFELSAAMFPPAIVVSFAAGAAAAAGAGSDSGWDLLHPTSMQAAAKAETANARVIGCLLFGRVGLLGSAAD
jgi:hypothetical protein